MSEPRIDLKNPWLAAVLAFLLPGAGHFYQRRTFKGALYCLCILGTFLYGMHLAEWKAVYAYAGEPGGPRQRVYGYFAQLGVGAPALIALAQGARYQNSENRHLRTLESPLSEPFTGAVVERSGIVARVSGRITLEPVMGRFGPEVAGTFEGTIDDRQDGPQPIRLRLQGPLEMERPISADSRRRLDIPIAERLEGPPHIEGDQYLTGSIPRSLWNWFAVPPEQGQIERLHRDLGRFFDLGMVYTWIAGLLNILAIWDALEGPAYGYGDEEEDEEQSGSSKKDTPRGAGQPASGASAATQTDGSPQTQSADKAAGRKS